MFSGFGREGREGHEAPMERRDLVDSKEILQATSRLVAHLPRWNMSRLNEGMEVAVVAQPVSLCIHRLRVHRSPWH
jgi:hypothetical protein